MVPYSTLLRLCRTSQVNPRALRLRAAHPGAAARERAAEWRAEGRERSGGLVLLEVYGGQWQLKLFFLFAASFKRRVGGWNPIGKNWMAPNEKSAPDREFWGVGNRLSWSEAGLKPPKTHPTKPPRRTSPTENPPVRATSSPALQLIPWPHMSSPTCLPVRLVRAGHELFGPTGGRPLDGMLQWCVTAG